MLVRDLGLIATSSETCQSMLGAEFPESDAGRRNVRLLETRLLSTEIQGLGDIECAGLDADPGGLIQRLALPVAIGDSAPILEGHLFVLHRVRAVVVEGVRHGHGPLRGRPGLRCCRRPDGLAEMYSGFFRASEQIEHHPGPVVRRSEFALIERESLIELAGANELLTLTD